MQKSENIEKFKVNLWYLTFFVLVMAANGISVAWTTGGHNQVANVFAAKLNWSDTETRSYNSIINLSAQIGKSLGAIYGGVLIGPGRKKAFIRYNILGVASCALMQVVSVSSLVVGKFLHGFTITVVHIAANKMINETVPVYKLGVFGSAIQIATNIGYCFVLGSGLILPTDDYNPALGTAGKEFEKNRFAKEADIADQNWRIVLAFPALINALILTFYCLCIKEDSIMFNLSQGNEEGSLILINKIYDISEGSGQDSQVILSHLKKQVKKKDIKNGTNSEQSYFQALFGPQNRRGTLILSVYSLSFQWIGCNIINIFSNRIITDVNRYVPEDKKVLANSAT